MKTRGRKKKDQFADLDSDFKDSVSSMDTEGIRKRVAEIALAQEELLKAKSEDQDLKDKLEQVKVASAVYREGTKANRLRIQFAKQVLEGRGA